MERKRLFVAVELPENVKHELKKICDYFVKKELFVGRCTNPENLHLTLKFLGSVYENIIPKIDKELKNIYFNSCKAQLSTLDLLPSKKKIRVLFSHLKSPKLHILANKIKEVLSDMFEPESRDFKNHITLARIKSVDDKDAFIKEIENFEVPQLSFEINEFVLKESELTDKGPIYKTLYKYKLHDAS